ncbi:hypothetical protein ACFP56_08705 [Paenibacillus septentrionalis]|uniref:Uncharacterized protein n=1 Tax=Paenibacillus septentrionalis TaxID=429342 RepID=A0ABW1V2D3_9BACL
MSSSPHNQAYAYRRNPSQSIHPSTFHPQQAGHGHGGTVIPARPPQAHYTTSASISPFQPAQSTTSTAVAVVEKDKEKDKKSSSGGFNLASLTKYANVDELKGLVDRFGGLEGILSTVTTVQKVVSTVGQIAPMVKVVTGVLGKKNNNPAAEAPVPARRRVRSTRPRPTRTNRSVPVRRNVPGPGRQGQGRAHSPRRSTPLTRRQGIR